MEPLRPTPFSAVRALRTGEFDEDHTYGVWRPEGTGDWLLILTLGGAGRIAHRGGVRRAVPGSASLFAPQVPHDYRTHPDAGHWHLRWAHFVTRPHWEPLLDWPAVAGDPGVRALEPKEGSFQRMAGTLGEADRIERGEGPRAQEFALNALERVLLEADLANPRSATRALDDRVQQALAFLTERYTEPWTLRQLAEAVHLSPSRFSHLFKEQMGVTPLQHLERLRMQAAKQLLEMTTLPVSAVAARVGHRNPFYFSNRFRRVTGQSPRQYRGGSGDPGTSPG